MWNRSMLLGLDVHPETIDAFMAILTLTGRQREFSRSRPNQKEVPTLLTVEHLCSSRPETL